MQYWVLRLLTMGEGRFTMGEGRFIMGKGRFIMGEGRFTMGKDGYRIRYLRTYGQVEFLHGLDYSWWDSLGLRERISLMLGRQVALQTPLMP